HVVHVQEIFWQRRLFMRVLQHALATAAVVVCISRAAAEQFDDERVQTRCRLIYTGVDIPGDIDETTPLSGNSVDVITVGRLNEWKGQEILIESVGLLREEFPGLRLRVVGDVFGRGRDYRARLERQVADLGLGNVVAFEG